MKKKNTRKIAIVTGGASGIGFPAMFLLRRNAGSIHPPAVGFIEN
jgi:NAD(P)-dependent dehydrogenase (short-subunit alcohol dehydrogenase family)